MKLSPVFVGSLGMLVTVMLLWLSASMLVTKSIPRSGIQARSTASKPNFNQPENNIPVAEIAKQVTVRVLTEPGSGSGVIIERQGETYTVLTCKHVIADSQSDRYHILTFDGMTYPATKKSISIGNADLALVQFQSQKIYRVPVLGNSKTVAVGEKVYASGFPNYYFPNQDVVEETRNWGNKAFRLTTGKVAMLLQPSLLQGYRLGYTNEIEIGMSGGPLLNASGQLIGINGRLKYPIQGIDVYNFTDGTKPSTEMFEQMEALSWAIPISTFQQTVEKPVN